MYTCTMRRTQVYLTDAESTALDRAAAKTGRSRSYLIRDAIAQRYLSTPVGEDAAQVLLACAGAWAGRTDIESGEAFVDERRGGHP